MFSRQALLTICIAVGGGPIAHGHVPATGALAPSSVQVFVATLTGPHESPPNPSTGTGSAVVTINTGAHTMRVQVSFSGLTSPNTAAHIHAATAVPFTSTAGVATTTPTFTAFPSGTTSGTYDMTFDTTLASTYNPAFVTAQGSVAAAEAALFGSLAVERAYLNIHTINYAGGEIRGFLVPAFFDDPLAAGATPIAAVHVTALRARIDAQRQRYNLPLYAWADPILTPGSSVIRAQHVLEMRAALADAYTAATLTPPTYSGPTPAPGATIVVAHIAELRAAVLALEG